MAVLDIGSFVLVGSLRSTSQESKTAGKSLLMVQNLLLWRLLRQQCLSFSSCVAVVVPVHILGQTGKPLLNCDIEIVFQAKNRKTAKDFRQKMDGLRSYVSNRVSPMVFTSWPSSIILHLGGEQCTGVVPISERIPWLSEDYFLTGGGDKCWHQFFTVPSYRL